MGLGRKLGAISLCCALGFTTACGGSGSSPTTTPTPTPAPSVPPPSPTSKVVLGYYIEDAQSYAAVTSFAGYMNVVSVDVYTVRADGTIAGNTPASLTAFAAAQGMQTYVCVNNFSGGTWDAQLAHAAIVTSRAATVSNLVALARSGGFAGVNLDLEGLHTGGDIDDDRTAFSEFVVEIAAALHAQGLKLAISAPAKAAENREDTWSYPFDYAVLGSHADLVQLMTYDQHGPWGGPGPVAGRDWMERCVVYAKGLIPPAKLLIGLPAYGYNWDLDDTTRDSDFMWKNVASLVSSTGAVVQYQESSDSPFITYRDAIGHRREAWFENERSIAAKTALVRAHGLAGVSMWRLGQEDLRFWTALRGALD